MFFRVKGKRTPKVSLKDGPKVASMSYFSEDEDSEKTDISDPKPTTVSKVLETNSGYLFHQLDITFILSVALQQTKNRLVLERRNPCLFGLLFHFLLFVR